MATFQRFEDIVAWQKARELSKKIYSVSGKGKFSGDFGLKDQIRRASVSTMSNIAEGFERDGNKEFVYFLAIAKGSLGELRSQLYIALDQEYVKPEEHTDLMSLATETGRMIAGLMMYISGANQKGKRFK